MPAPISAEALSWTQQDWRALGRELLSLKNFQIGWFMRLYIGCATSVQPGYLVIPQDRLWMYVGATSAQHFSMESAPVLACFRAQCVGTALHLHHPGLLASMAEGTAKLHGKRRARGAKSSDPPGSPPFPQDDVSSSCLSKEEIQSHGKKPPNSAQLASISLGQIAIPGSPQLLTALTSAIDIETLRQEIAPAKAAEYLVGRIRLYQATTHRIWNLSTFIQDARYRDEPSSWENGNGKQAQQANGKLSAAKQRAVNNVSACVRAIQTDRERRGQA